MSIQYCFAVYLTFCPFQKSSSMHRQPERRTWRYISRLALPVIHWFTFNINRNYKRRFLWSINVTASNDDDDCDYDLTMAKETKLMVSETKKDDKGCTSPTKFRPQKKT